MELSSFSLIWERRLIVGPVFEKIFDKAKISREKLAWIIDSTSSPVAVLSSVHWMGSLHYGIIKQEFDLLNITTSEFSTLVSVIPFQFYAILAVLMVPLVAMTKLDFGPMAKAERRVQTTGALIGRILNHLEKLKKIVKVTKGSHAILIWLPLVGIVRYVIRSFDFIRISVDAGSRNRF